MILWPAPPLRYESLMNGALTLWSRDELDSAGNWPVNISANANSAMKHREDLYRTMGRRSRSATRISIPKPGLSSAVLSFWGLIQWNSYSQRFNYLGEPPRRGRPKPNDEPVPKQCR